MSRAPSSLNIKVRPPTGQSYIIKNIKTGQLFRCATAAHRDLRRKELAINTLGAFSVDEPFFMVKFGTFKTGMKSLKFLCGVHRPKCLDENGEYEWTEIPWKEAKKNGLSFYDPYDQKNKSKVADRQEKSKSRIKSKNGISIDGEKKISNSSHVNRVAKHGEKMIRVSVRFWTNNISENEDSIIPKNAWTSGSVNIEANDAHEISPLKPVTFNTLLEIPQAIEKVLIDHGIILHISHRKSKYIVGKSLR